MTDMATVSNSELLKALHDVRCAFGHPDDPEVEAWWEARAETAAEHGHGGKHYQNEALATAEKLLLKAGFYEPETPAAHPHPHGQFGVGA
jgi:hypothetical protein